MELSVPFDDDDIIEARETIKSIHQFATEKFFKCRGRGRTRFRELSILMHHDSRLSPVEGLQRIFDTLYYVAMEQRAPCSKLRWPEIHNNKLSRNDIDLIP